MRRQKRTNPNVRQIPAPAHDPAHGLPYDPGNAADLLKHGWLAVMVPWLLSKDAGAFRYADSFAGEWDYELLPRVSARLSRLKSTPLSRYSQSAWQDGRYLGSTGLVGAIASHERRPVEIWVGDRCSDRVARLVANHSCHELPESGGGYAVLRSDQRYDLILLDPFADFLREAPRWLPEIVARSANCSLLLVVLAESHESEAYREYVDAFRQQCRTQGATAIVGGVPALPHSTVRGESRHDAEVVLIPRRDVAPAFAEEVLPQLAAMTAQVAVLLGDAAEARLRMYRP